MERLLLWLIPLLPLGGAVIIRALPATPAFSRLPGFLACTTTLLSFIATIVAYCQLTQQHNDSFYLISHLFTWISVQPFQVNMSIMFDSLSAVMALVVTGVGLLIHIYSLGYMEHDRDQRRFFSYLNLFMAMMLILILADNMLLMFVGWEGVGLCSYLLIGFWFDDPANANAGKKALIVNRIGDFGLLIGMLTLFSFIGIETGIWTLDFSDITQHAPTIEQLTIFGLPVLTFATLMLFLGATGKSAQIPLYVWLPDAMAGPTPVSALIHAATMVTSGIYLLCRLSCVFELAPITLGVIAMIGCVTALLAALLGLVQNDIKKILAYSTISQLGFMFLACGVGAYASALFHVVTHAFFKGLLFLGAGSVIHAMNGEQDIRRMGGLIRCIPLTYITFLVGTLAIAGIFPFAGFFSKDEILWQVWNSSKALWAMGLLTSFLTAFYMFRLLTLTFHGRCRATAQAQAHIHESARVMTVPLVALSVCSLIVGWLWVPGFFHVVHFPQIFPGWIEQQVVIHKIHGAIWLEVVLALVSLAVAFIAIGMADYLYRRRVGIVSQLAQRFTWAHTLLMNKYWVDEAYQFIFVNGTLYLSQLLHWFDVNVIDRLVVSASKVCRSLAKLDGWIDDKIIDGTVNGVATRTQIVAGYLRRTQTGQIQSYIQLLAGSLLFGYVIWITLGFVK